MRKFGGYVFKWEWEIYMCMTVHIANLYCGGGKSLYSYMGLTKYYFVHILPMLLGIYSSNCHGKQLSKHFTFAICLNTLRLLHIQRVSTHVWGAKLDVTLSSGVCFFPLLLHV